MLGHYIKGSGLAHNCCAPHKEIFNCDVYGTFNIYVPNFNILAHKPSIINPNNDKQYWFLIIKDNLDREYCGWAIRDKSSKQRQSTLEVLTKKPLPEVLKEQELDITLPIKWNKRQIKMWAIDKYWFQTFSFSPKKRADSNLVWETINIVNWEKQTVLDWGCHYGYMSFEASKKGAIVTGVDNNIKTLNMAKTIRNHIIQQDVQFINNFNYKSDSYDIVFYLSVHQQRDSSYMLLKDTIDVLKRIARKHVFIELIMPPVFPKDNSMTESDINNIVGGTVLLKYKHNVRGMRNIYHIAI